MPFKLPPNVYEPDQLAMCVEELKGLAAAKTKQPATVSDETIALVAALPPAKRKDEKALADLADELAELTVSAPRLTLTLAALASHGLREELVAWIRTNLKPDALVSFRTNPDIAGGMIVRTTNKVFDLSFRKQLLADPAIFTEVLRRV